MPEALQEEQSMLFKIAFRNVRRQIGSYLIYFVTVALTVSILFSLDSLMFSETVFNISIGFKAETILVCIFLALVLCVISALVLGYGSAFLLRRRKKEFGMYLALGMTRGNIVSIFVGEMFFTFLFSLAVGLGLGMLIYQGIVAVLSSFLMTDFTWADYHLGAFLLTIVLVGVVFLISTAVCAGYLRFETLAKLLQGSVGKQKLAKNPRFWLIVTIISVCLLVISLIVLVLSINPSKFGSTSKYVICLVSSSGIAFVAIIFSYIGALKCVIHYLLRNKRFSARGTRTFVLRQISGRLSGDSVLFGVIAVLLSVVIAGGNIFLTAFGTQVAQQHQSNPFTVSVSFAYDETGERAKDMPQWMEQFGKTEEVRTYSTFFLPSEIVTAYLHSAILVSAMRESDYLALAEMAGEEAEPAGEGFVVLLERPSRQGMEEVKKFDFSDFRLEVGGYSLPFSSLSSIRCSLVVGSYAQYIVVLPDVAVDALEQSGDYGSGNMHVPAAESFCAVNYADDKFDEERLDRFFRDKNDELPETTIYNQRFQVDISGDFLETLVQLAAPWLMIVMFITIAFALLSMAILALKSLASVAEDKQRYRMLFLAGASQRNTLSALTAQIALWFILPFVVPIFLNLPVAFICIALNDMMSGGALSVLQVVGNTVMFSGLLLFFYALYCSVTCLVARLDVRRILPRNGKRKIPRQNAMREE